MAVQPTQSRTLYKNKIQVDFYEASHRYRITDLSKKDSKPFAPIASVTGVTGLIDKSRVLLRWASGLTRDHLLGLLHAGRILTEDDVLLASTLHEKRAEQAATRGSLAHAWIEEFIKTGKKPETPQDSKVANGVIAFLKWIREHKVEFIESELLVYSLRYGYAGLMDAKAKIDGKLCVIDFKTSSGVYDEMKFQVSAYRAAEEEATGKKFAGANHIIRIDKETADFEVHTFDEQDKDFSAFVGLLAATVRIKELQAEWRKENT